MILFMTKHTTDVISLKIRNNTIQWLFSYNMGDSWHFKIEINVLSVSIIPRRILPCITRNIDTVPLFNTRHTFYKNSFYTCTTVEWNNLDKVRRYNKTFGLFRSNTVQFIRPPPNNLPNCQDISTRLAARLY